MIVPMKKCLVVMLDSCKVEGLQALRSLGLVHVEPVAGQGRCLEELRNGRILLEKAAATLSGIHPSKDLNAVEGMGGLEAAKALEDIEASERRNLELLALAQRERDRIAPWGDFDPASLADLAGSGYLVRLHSLQAKAPAVFPEGCLAVLAGQAKGRVYYLSFSPSGLDPSLLPEALTIPDKGLKALEAEIAELKAEAARLKKRKAELAGALPAVQKELALARRGETFENLRSGMPQDSGLAYLEGWIPASEEARLAALAKERGWGLSCDEPADEEMPPTKVSNGPLVRIIQPVFDFLGTVPNYREYEISLWFLAFFCIFFAMIFGDGGYGAVMLLAGAVIAVASKARGGKVPDMVRLLLLLSASTMAWGALTGSWFGLPLEALPAFFRKISIPWIASDNPEAGENVKLLCFYIAIIQLSLAHLKNLRRDIRSPKVLAQLGQLAMLVGVFFLVRNLVLDAETYPMPVWALYAILAGFGLNFIFANYQGGRGLLRGIISGVLESLKNIVSVLLGVVNVFADIVSYIRLWAVGLAGAAISQTVNGMAGPLFGHMALFLAGVVLVLFGHGLNIVMSVLSVIVHGVRLNMLEFSGHLGMEWSGYKYEPFRETPTAEEP